MTTEEQVAYFKSLPQHRYDETIYPSPKKLNGVVKSPSAQDYINHECFWIMEFFKNGDFIIKMFPMEIGEKYFTITGEEVDLKNLQDMQKLQKVFRKRETFEASPY
jgi:hypothetical protein